MPADGDWPRSAATTEENWHRAVAALEQAHEELGATLAGVDPAVLADRVGTERDPAAGTGITYEDMLHGLLQQRITWGRSRCSARRPKPGRFRASRGLGAR
jgi:hypothetical protein